MNDPAKDFLRISAEVQEALRERKPVVAFESTIISHGMPYPRNREVALAAEALARTDGVVPATVALLDGRICIGLTGDEIERLSTQKDVLKVSRRDLAWALAGRRTGATTVSATMLAASRAGVDVFATGGIGGVHRGTEGTSDVSADLSELAATSVCVVSAGAKAVLDIPRTLEVLETLGVPVACWGTSEFPAFYSRTSGCPSPLRVDSAEEVARMLRTQRALGLPQGILVAVPVPKDQEIPNQKVERWIEKALGEAAGKGIKGNAVTPFLLSRLGELSGGASLESNVSLFHNNVRHGCLIATAISRTAASS